LCRLNLEKAPQASAAYIPKIRPAYSVPLPVEQKVPPVYARAMKCFFERWSEIDDFLAHLAAMRCPVCGASGSFGRHGFICGHLDDRGGHGVRARRIRCRPKLGGCGRTWSLRPGDGQFRYCFGTRQAWNFLRNVLRGHSVKAA
jgi:hypothetical protein